MRLPAEWEPQTALMITYPSPEGDWKPLYKEVKRFYDSFIRTVSKFQRVLLLCKEPPALDIDNVSIVKIETNDTWVRDYGPISLKNGNETELLDFTFNGWGLKYRADLDNRVNRKLFKTKKLPFVLEGGAIESNGAGVLMTTERTQLESNRNPHLTKEEIEWRLKRFFNLNRVVWLKNGYLEGDDTDSHIDMLARFVDVKKVVHTLCDDVSDSHYAPLKKMEEELNSYGFETVALPWPSPKYHEGSRLPASYANFVIINGAVIVPLYGDEMDKEALGLFEHLFPDREVIGLDASVLITQRGSIHCSCMNLFGYNIVQKS